MRIDVKFSEINSKFEAGMGEVVMVDSGVSDHNKLINRDADDSHPISAITDLDSTLDGKLESSELQSLTNTEIEELINSFV